MIYTIQRGLSRVRYAEGDNLQAAFEPADIISTTWVSAEISTIVDRTIAVEFIQPRGPQKVYGLLGGSLRKSNNGKSSIGVGITNSKLPYTSELATKAGGAQLGLSREFGVVVLDAAKEYLVDFPGLTESDILINIAAYSPIGSSWDAFSSLAKFIVSSLIGSESLSEEVIIEALNL